MNQMRQWWADFLRYEPAVQAWALAGGIALILAYVFQWDHTKEAAAATVVTGLAAIFQAARTHPLPLTVVTGAFATAATGLATFGYHLPPHVIALAEAAAAAILPLLYRHHLVSAAFRREQPKPAAPPVAAPPRAVT